jgi:hypothetical protein
MIEAAVELEGPDVGAHPAPNAEVIYPSIDDLYYATLTLLVRYMRAFGMDPATDSNVIMDILAAFWRRLPIVSQRGCSERRPLATPLENA